MNKVVYLDMDGVIADFWSGVGRPNPEVNPPEMLVKGFFKNLGLLPGAREAVSELLSYEGIDLYIASKPAFRNANSYTEKVEWIGEHFPALTNKILLVCDKGHLNGDFLIDDDAPQWAHRFKGTFLEFNRKEPIESWNRIISLLGKYKYHGKDD